MPNANPTPRVPNTNYIPLLALGLVLGVQGFELAQGARWVCRGLCWVHETI